MKLAGSSGTTSHQLSFTQLRSMVREGDIREMLMLAADPPVGDNIAVEISEMESKLPRVAKGVLTLFVDVFTEPRQLPPHRGTDHRICLNLSSQQVKVRPYRYPYFQKDVIEKMVQEMLSYGFIQPSTSPYSSPVYWSRRRMALGDFV